MLGSLIKKRLRGTRRGANLARSYTTVRAAISTPTYCFIFLLRETRCGCSKKLVVKPKYTGDRRKRRLGRFLKRFTSGSLFMAGHSQSQQMCRRSEGSPRYLSRKLWNLTCEAQGRQFCHQYPLSGRHLIYELIKFPNPFEQLVILSVINSTPRDTVSASVTPAHFFVKF